MLRAKMVVEHLNIVKEEFRIDLTNKYIMLTDLLYIS